MVDSHDSVPGSVYRSSGAARRRSLVANWLRILYRAGLDGLHAGQRGADRCRRPDHVRRNVHTRGPSKGIYAYHFNSASGKTTPIGLVAETENPSFLAIHPNQRFLYAANEISMYEGQAAGSVSAFAIDPATHGLKLLNRVSSRGTGPCHVAVDKTGKWLFVANYNSGSVAAFPIHEDGSLGEASAFFQHAGSSVNKERQTGPHAHVVALSPDNRFVLVADLGLDRVFSYRVDSAKGGLAPNDPPFVKIEPGSGPRHVAFRPDAKFVYSINGKCSPRSPRSATMVREAVSKNCKPFRRSRKI